MDIFLADNRILYFWQILESFRKFIIEFHVLQCLFVRGSNEKQRWGKIISNFTKGETFNLWWQPSALGDNLTMWSPFLKKRPSSTLHFGQEENIPWHIIEGRAYWFVLKIAWVFPTSSGRVGIGWSTVL